MSIIRALVVAVFAAFFAHASAPAASAQAVNNAASGEYVGWVRWGGDAPITDVSWRLHPNGTLTTYTTSGEHGYWMQVGDYVEFLYFCSGEYLCHYRGRMYGDVIRGAATSNQGHTASFEMRRQR